MTAELSRLSENERRFNCMKTFLNFVMIFSIVSLTSCAFSRTEVKIDYTPNISAASLGSASIKSVTVAQVKDDRGVSDPTIIFQKSNAYGKTSGCYAADRPISEIIKTGLIQALGGKNYRIETKSADYELLTTIQDFSYEFIDGFWTGTLKPKMTARFEVIDRASGKGIWRDTVIGRSSIKCGACSDYMVQALTLTTDDVISRLLEEQSFQELFK